MPSNTAAWLTGKGQPLKVKPSDYVSPGKGELIIKTKASAINPVDLEIQKLGKEIFNWMKFPHVCGSDVAGEVVEVGPGVTRFKAGDRVVGLTLTMTGAPADGGFQEYTLLREVVTAPFPDSLSYEKACCLPLGLSTAACALYQKDCLGLDPPSLSPKPTDKCVLIWGGSTSPGSNAIQLAVASGYHVLTTASPQNFDYVKKLGATDVFDYKSPTAVQDILKTIRGKTFVGALAINQEADKTCYQVAANAEGNKSVVIFNQSSTKVPKGVESKFVFGGDLVNNEVGPMIWHDFLPPALAQGKYVIPPEPEIVGRGLDYVQPAYEVQRRGVSARKAVVSL